MVLWYKMAPGCWASDTGITNEIHALDLKSVEKCHNSKPWTEHKHFFNCETFHPHLPSRFIQSMFIWTFNMQKKASFPVKPQWNCTPACLAACRMLLVMGTHGTETWSRAQQCWSVLQQWLWARAKRGCWKYLQVWSLYHPRDNKRLRRQLLSLRCFWLFDWETPACALKAKIILESSFSKS